LKNHFVPEFYFKPWLDERGHLLQFSWQRRGLVVDLKTPGQICYRKDLHTFTGPVGAEKRDAVEDWLTKVVDSEAARVIRQILSKGLSSIDSAQGSHMVRFILSLIVRAPENVELLIAQTPEELKRNMALAEPKIRVELEEVATAGDVLSLLSYAEKVHPGLIQNSGKFMMPGIIADRKFGERLYKMDWWAIDFTGTSAVPHFASDRAVVLVGTGLDDPNAVLALPLSPCIVLYVSAPGQKSRLLGQGKGLLGINTMRAVLSSSRRFAYGIRGSNTNLAEKYLPKPSGAKQVAPA
jgi:hypothetical protein